MVKVDSVYCILYMSGAVYDSISNQFDIFALKAKYTNDLCIVAMAKLSITSLCILNRLTGSTKGKLLSMQPVSLLSRLKYITQCRAS